MPKKHLNASKPIHGYDWIGNNAAFTCPVCQKVFIVSSFFHKDSGRKCPQCEKATGYCTGGPKSGEAFIEWE